MSRLSLLVWALLLLSAAAQAQDTVTIPYDKSIVLERPDATAAYSLDPQVAEAASVADGRVTIRAVGPGSAAVIVVMPDGPQTVTVTVLQPVPNRPIQLFADNESAPGENGSYEVRYNSNPGQLTNAIEFRKNEGDSFRRLQVVNANYLNDTSGGRVGFPLVAYEIGNHQRDLIFLDATVNNSPLTVDGSLIRGFHYREGAWQFHGGYTSLATFQDYFLTTDPQYVVGLSRTYAIANQQSLTANAYQFFSPAIFRSSSRDGAVGSLVYRFHPNKRLDLLSEIGVSRGVGFATRFRYEGERQQLTGNFRYEPQEFAALPTQSLHGTFADANYSRIFSERFAQTVSFSETEYNLPNLQQKILTFNEQSTVRLDRQFSVLVGSVYSHFSAPGSATLESLSTPVGMQFTTRHFSAGGQYQPTTDLAGSFVNAYGGNAGGNFRQFNLSAYYRRDADVLTSTALLGAVPGLEDLLGRSAALALSPDQLAALLRQTGVLQALGLTPGFAVNLTPLRDDVGGSASWTSTGAHRQRVDFSFLNSRAQLVTSAITFRTVSAHYLLQIGHDNEIGAGFSLYQNLQGASSSVQPVFEISFRHRFHSVPYLLLPGRHGTISGHVFRDDPGSGHFTQQPTMAGVEIVLDEARTTHSDARGYFAFAHVPYGPHQIRAKFTSAEPYFFTTDSPANAEINSTVDFGIAFLRGQIFGRLLNDGGAGVAGVIVELRGPNGTKRTQTAAGGGFTFAGLDAGEYGLASIADSYPFGYDLQQLTSAAVHVDTGSPAHVELHAKAVRAIGGTVKVYDPQRGELVPLPGLTVRLEQLRLENTTDAEGRFIFRNLPAGIFKLTTAVKGKDITQSVTLPPEPTNLTDVTIVVPRP